MNPELSAMVAFSELARSAAKGGKPGDLRVEQPTLKAAKAPGLTIPSSLLARADEMIE